MVKGRFRTIAVNDAWRLAPWADLLYACDFAWWDHHGGVPDFRGAKVSQDQRCPLKWPEILRIRGEHRPGLSLDPDCIHFGSNSGYQALNLAVLLGAKRIVLLGFDMKPAPDGRRHWFGNHPGALHRHSPYGDWIRNFRTTLPDLERAGVEVINCTPGSALDCFPSARMEDVI